MCLFGVAWYLPWSCSWASLAHHLCASEQQTRSAPGQLVRAQTLQNAVEILLCAPFPLLQAVMRVPGW